MYMLVTVPSYPLGKVGSCPGPSVEGGPTSRPRAGWRSDGRWQNVAQYYFSGRKNPLLIEKKIQITTDLCNIYVFTLSHISASVLKLILQELMASKYYSMCWFYPRSVSCWSVDIYCSLSPSQLTGRAVHRVYSDPGAYFCIFDWCCLLAKEEEMCSSDIFMKGKL